MRLFEFSIKERVKKAIDKMEDNDPILIHVKNAIFDSVFQREMENSSINKRIKRPEALSWFKQSLESVRVPLEHKIRLLKLMEDQSNLIPKSVYETNTNGNIIAYIGDKIKRNEAFKALQTPMWQFKIGGQGGMGPGELFMALMSQGGSEGVGKKGGDLDIDGWKVELKKDGVVPPGDSGQKIVDSLNNNLLNIAKEEGFLDSLLTGSSKKETSTNLESGWFPGWFKIYKNINGEEKSKKKFKEYMSSLYHGIPNQTVDSMWRTLGTPECVRILSPYIFEMYKESHGWDSICIVDDNFHFVNLVTFENIPNNMNITVKLKRGGDTNAVADGYIIVGLKTESQLTKKDKVKKQTDSNTVDQPKARKSRKYQPQSSVDNKQSTVLQPPQSSKSEVPKQNKLDIENTLRKFLKDNPNDDLSLIFKQLDRQTAEEAIEDAVELIMSGTDKDEIIRLFKNGYLEESAEIRRIKKLFQFQ